jgi:hypothetical protein
MAELALPGPPDLESPAAALVDWLELRAFTSAEGRASIDHLRGASEIDDEADVGQIDDDDEVAARLAGNVDAEVEKREQALGDVYPFEYSDGGVLGLNTRWAESAGQVGYLFCLAVDNFALRGLLHDEIEACRPELREARRLFQILATVATAGRVSGPTFSFGWPRPDGSGFHAKLTSVWAEFRDGQVVSPPPSDWADAKDGGVDVVGWSPRADRLPGTRLILGQAASGANWRQKAFVPEARTLLDELFHPRPVSEPEFVTLVPFLPDERDARSLKHQLGILLGRLMLPVEAEAGVRLAERGTHTVEDATQWTKIVEWLEALQRRFPTFA